MERETSNKLRFIIEELIPPIIRDSFIFTYIIKKIHRSDDLHFNLKDKIFTSKKNIYQAYYKIESKIHNQTDLSKKCISEIHKNIKGKKVIDVGCGNGYLLKTLSKMNLNLSASDVKIFPKNKNEFKRLQIKYREEQINNINYKKNSFDTVICTHVLEHILEIEKAYKKLIAITKHTLIIVIPKERPYKHTFNGHIHFFPYHWCFINLIKPKNNYKIFEINRDFIYIEHK